MRYADAGLRREPSIVMTAVSQEGMALEFVSADLQARDGTG